MKRALGRAALTAPGALLLGLLTLPLLALASGGAGVDLWSGLSHPLVAPALRLSLVTTLVSLAVLVALGTPLAWRLARSHGRVASVVESVAQLPIVVPPAVAGVALLLAFGRRGLVGAWLERVELGVAFSAAAVVLAQVFVASPFYLQAAIAAFRRVDPELYLVARSFGASEARVFAAIALPIAAPGLIAGAAVAWARALGEFGATLLFAGNLEGRTQTLPLAIYTAMEQDLGAARALSLVLVSAAFALLLLVRGAERASAREPR